jgi:hypothetical protein
MGLFNAKIETSGNSKYLTLKSGDRYVGTFQGSPKEGWVLWIDGKPQPAEYGTPGAKFQFEMAFVLKDTFEAKIFKGGVSIYSQLKKLESEGYDLLKTWISISRKGEKLDTEYMVMPIPQFQIQGADAMNIEKALAKSPAKQANLGSLLTSDDVPFMRKEWL